MSNIEKIIKDKCKDGVKYIELGKIVKVLRGKRLTKSQLNEEYQYPVFHGGLEPLGYYEKYNREANTVMIINVGASAGTVGYSNIEFWSSDGCYCIEKSNIFIDKYLYYALCCKENELKSKVRVAGIPTLDAKVIEKIKIPVPPIEVQEEIVRILDNFTELTAELTAELTTRQKQYEYYRNKLLSFDESAESLDTLHTRILLRTRNKIHKIN